MKKLLSLILALVLVLSAMNALALNYSAETGNEATFETMGEARISAPLAVKDLETNAGRAYISHPVLDGYPEDTTFIYRSANLFGGRAAARLNTTILVFAEQHFEDKDSALAYLKELGLVDIIDQAIGSIVLTTPANGKTFAAADQQNYYKLQTAICAQKVAGTVNGARVYYSEQEYYGSYGYFYVVAIDGGATFFNNYIAPVFDYVSRFAGVLLVNGTMNKLYSVASLVPTYLVNAQENVLNAYLTANSVNATDEDAEAKVYFNQELPLQKVIVAKAEKDLAGYVEAAYYDMFIKAMRVPVGQNGLYSASTAYQGYSGDAAPYSLCERSAVIDGKTADGIYVLECTSEDYSEYKTADGEYLQTWFMYLPEEVLNNTAPTASVPLFLGTHGTNDDPRLFVDEIGLLSLAGQERFAILAPEINYLAGTRTNDGYSNSILSTSMPMLVEDMLAAYPALDPSRVYVTGYSKGGSVTLQAICGKPELFAAAVPMAVPGYSPSEEENGYFATVDIPVLFSTSSYDMPVDQATTSIGASYQKMINRHLGYNEMTLIDYDFETYPICGFAADRVTTITLNGETKNTTWLINNEDGIPMVGLTFTEKNVHALYPEYVNLVWNFVRHYSRNQVTGEIEYQP